MRRIVFVITQLSQPRCIKRVKAFSDAGFEVEVYGFDNGLYSKNISSYPCDIHKIQVKGKVSKVKSIFQNIKLVRKAGKELQKSDLMYIFGIEMAVYYRLFGQRNSFIYEQADLNYTKLSNRILVNLFKMIDKSLIARSYKTVLTSQGFIDYLFTKQEVPSSIVLLENRLNKIFCNYSYDKHDIDVKALRFAFIGLIRYPKTLFTFAKVIAEHFPNYQFHFYGEGPVSLQAEELCLHYNNNLFYHGGFSNPSDLPKIYSEVDISVVCYDTNSLNVRLAEPNKLYEAIYFGVPIIVSANTFLEKKVKRLGVGYGVDASNSTKIIEVIESLTQDSINACLESIARFNTNDLFDNSLEFAKSIRNPNNKS